MNLSVWRIWIWRGWLVVALVGWSIPSQAQTDPDLSLPPPSVQSQDSATAASENGSYFADILVRGRPVFQVGSLSDITAEQRADSINRRISSFLTRSNNSESESVTVQLASGRDIATLQVNNRILMTVTQQDAQDYDVPLEELAQLWSDRLNQAFDRPPLAIDVVQRLNETVRQLGRDAIDRLPALLGALVVMVVTWLIAKGVRFGAFTWAQQTEGDRSTEILVGRLGYGGIWVIGSIIALGVLGLDFGALLGALGLTSVAIGFSLKDVLSNYISGVILLAARPFRLGDQVVIKDYEGTVTQIQLRGTAIRTYDGRLVYIPNQEVFQSSITNNTASPSRRSAVMVGIDYDADIRHAAQVIQSALRQIDLIEPSPPPEVLVKELAASTVNLEVRFWVNSQRIEFLQKTSEVAQAIKESLQQADVEMPTEIYTIVFRDAPLQLDGVKAQLTAD